MRGEIGCACFFQTITDKKKCFHWMLDTKPCGLWLLMTIATGRCAKIKIAGTLGESPAVRSRTKFIL